MGVAVSLATNESSASRAAANPGARGCRERVPGGAPRPGQARTIKGRGPRHSRWSPACADPHWIPLDPGDLGLGLPFAVQASRLPGKMPECWDGVSWGSGAAGRKELACSVPGGGGWQDA